VCAVDPVEFVVQISASSSHRSSGGEVSSRHVLFSSDFVYSRNSLPERGGTNTHVYTVTHVLQLHGGPEKTKLSFFVHIFAKY